MRRVVSRSARTSDLRSVRFELRPVEGRARLGRLRLLHLAEDPRRLLAAHHADARVRPHPHEARAVGAAAHAVVACRAR
eukprot:528130-Pleurochrysis_carterae.AAC.1